MHNVYKVIKSGNEWHAGVDRRGFGTKQDIIPLFFFMYVKILWQGQKAVLTMVEFEFFDIFYSRFQVASTFSICNKLCVENWLHCCDLICKWVTCRSGCKRFWKSALHIFFLFVLLHLKFWGVPSISQKDESEKWITKHIFFEAGFSSFHKHFLKKPTFEKRLVILQ